MGFCRVRRNPPDGASRQAIALCECISVVVGAVYQVSQRSDRATCTNTKYLDNVQSIPTFSTSNLHIRSRQVVDRAIAVGQPCRNEARCCTSYEPAISKLGKTVIYLHFGANFSFAYKIWSASSLDHYRRCLLRRVKAKVYSCHVEPYV